MLRLIRFLLTGDLHLHKWKTIAKGPIVDNSRTRTGTYYECQCEVCGKIKGFSL